jgi:hypothetical protein
VRRGSDGANRFGAEIPSHGYSDLTGKAGI